MQPDKTILQSFAPLRKHKAPASIISALSTEDQLSRFAQTHRLKTAFESDNAGHYIQEAPRIIPGRKGASHIFENDGNRRGVPDERNRRPDRSTAKAWNAAKAKLIAAGCSILRDAYGDGGALFSPSDPQQARAAIQAAAIRRERILSPEQLAALEKAGAASRFLSRTTALQKTYGHENRSEGGRR
jgi:hypothetical protein